MKLLLVGEAPGRDEGPPLEGAAAKFLAALAGIDVADLLAQTDRTNLLNHYPGREGGGAAFPMAAGRAAFYTRLYEFDARLVLFLGRAADAAELSTASFVWGTRRHGAITFTAARFPHPSGLNRQWNSKEVRSKASTFLRAALDAASRIETEI